MRARPISPTVNVTTVRATMPLRARPDAVSRTECLAQPSGDGFGAGGRLDVALSVDSIAVHLPSEFHELGERSTALPAAPLETTPPGAPLTGCSGRVVGAGAG